MAYVFDPINNTLIDDEDKSLGNKFQLNDERLNQSMGTNIMTLNPLFPEKDPTDFDSFKPLDVPGMALPVGATLGGMRLKDIFFSKDEEKKKKDADSDDKNILKRPDPNDPKNLEDLANSIEIAEAVERLKKKEMNPEKRDARTALARDLDLAVTKSGMLEIRQGDYLTKRLQTLKDKGVNFDGYYSVPEIANLLGTKSMSGINTYITDKNIPTVKQGLFKVVKLNDFLNVYLKTKERMDVAPEVDVRTKARDNFISEIGGNFYQKFKDLRKPKELPTKVKEVYDKYNLTEIEGGHPFPVEFFTKKYGKGNTLQKDRQFDWIYRNKNKLFDKNNLVFQSKNVNTLFRDSITDLKKQYQILSPLVDKYEGKGAVTNKEDAATIEAANNKIMDIVAKSEITAKEFIESSPNSVDLPRMRQGGLYGALFNTDTGEVSVYTGAGEGAGFVLGAAGDEPQDTKLKLSGDYLDIVSQIITDEADKKIFTDFIEKKLLPRFQKGGGVEITSLPRSNFGNGGAAGADVDFATELEYFFTNPDAELPVMQTYKETNNPIEVLNDIINPRNYPYYADVLARSGIRIAEFGGKLLPATGKLISDLIQKPAFKVKSTEDNYVRDYLDPPPPSNIKGTGIFSEFLENITPTTLEKKIGLDTLIKKEEQRLKDTGSTVGPKVFADTIGLGAEVTAPIFPGLKLLRAYAKKNNLPVNNVTQKLLIKEIDQVLEKQGMNRREFLQVTGAGATVILAKMLGFGDEVAKTAKVAEKAAEVSSGAAPTYFFDLVEIIKKKGIDTTKRRAIKDLENVYQYKGYEVYEDLATGEIRIEKISPEADMITERQILEFKPGRGDESNPKPPDEYEEVTETNSRIIEDEYNDPDYEEGINLEEILEFIKNEKAN